MEKRDSAIHLRGTQLPNLSGNSVMRSSLMRSFNGPRITTGRAYFTACSQHSHRQAAIRISLSPYVIVGIHTIQTIYIADKIKMFRTCSRSLLWSVIHVLPKFHENSALTLSVILLIDKQLHRQMRVMMWQS